MRLRCTRRRILLFAIGAIILVVATGWFATSYYSFESRFARSKVSLEAYATLAMASDRAKPLPALPSRLGSFKTSDVERLPHGFLFFCDYGHPFDANGIAYSLEPLPQVVNGRDTFTHIEGNWYSIWRN